MAKPQVSISEAIDKALEKLADNEDFNSKSEAARYILRKKLEQRQYMEVKNNK